MQSLEKLITLEKEATAYGFKWNDATQIVEQIRSETLEIDVHLKDGDKAKLQEEVGDLLHAAFTLCVFCHVDPHAALTDSVLKFERRFNEVKKLALNQGLLSLNEQHFSELMTLWDKAKELVG